MLLPIAAVVATVHVPVAAGINIVTRASDGGVPDFYRAAVLPLGARNAYGVAGARIVDDTRPSGHLVARIRIAPGDCSSGRGYTCLGVGDGAPSTVGVIACIDVADRGPLARREVARG